MIKNYTKIELPSDYAWQLLDSQIELELSRDIGVNLIQKLAELYALGVEYYESIHSYKYLYFQKKMSSLMVHPNLLKVQETTYQKYESPIKQQNIKVKQKQDEFEKKVLYKAGDVSENKVKDIVRCKEKEAEDYNKKVKQTLDKQADSIKQKLMKRKQASQLKMSQSLIELTTHSSESSLEASAIQLQRPKIKRQEQDQSNYDNDKPQEQATQVKDHVQQNPIKTKSRTRTRTNTNKVINYISYSKHHRRSKSLQSLRISY